MAMIDSISLLMLVAGCYCAPGSWLDIGGTVGYDSHINGTIGGHLKGDRDGLSINGTGRGIIGASWAPTLVARGHAQVGSKVIAGDASLKTVIDNSWQPGFQGEIGRNSNGTWLLGFNPDSQLYNKFLLTPNVQVKTGDDARKLVGLPVKSESQNGPVPQVNGAPIGPYAAGYPYGSNPYMYNPYAYNPYAAYANMAPYQHTANGAPNPYAYAYAQAIAQSQLAQSQLAQSQFAQSQLAQSQFAQSQLAQSQVSPNASPEQSIEQETDQAQVKA